MKLYNIITILSLSILLGITQAENCGKQAGGAVCPNGLCCSRFGWCGSTDDHCLTGCQSQCRNSGGVSTPSPRPPSGGGGDVGSLISASLFEQILKHRNDGACEGRGFYTYNAFITAARSFNGFGTSGDVTARKRELAAFLAQTSHETTGGWGSAPDGPYAWGYCFVREKNQDVYCSSNQFPCAPGRKYYGRGPIQLTQPHWIPTFMNFKRTSTRANKICEGQIKIILSK